MVARHSLVFDAPTFQLASLPTSLRVALFVCPLVVFVCLFTHSLVGSFAYQQAKRALGVFNSEFPLLFIMTYLLVLNYLNYSVLDIFTSKCFVGLNKFRILAS